VEKRDREGDGKARGLQKDWLVVERDWVAQKLHLCPPVGRSSLLGKTGPLSVFQDLMRA